MTLETTPAPDGRTAGERRARTRGRPSGPALAVVLAVAAVLGWAAGAAACVLDAGIDDGSPVSGYLFPNWKQVETTIFDTDWCDATTCPGYSGAEVVGLTLLNYGTATGGAAGDITNVYVCWQCSTAAACAPNTTLTYAGVWNVNGTNYPAWTWSGDDLINTDPCTNCACTVLLNVFVDINACPTNGNTVQMGLGFNDIVNPNNPGGITDVDDCDAPASSAVDPAPKTIAYALKTADRSTAAPGDTITYTITYGRPGAGPLSNIVVLDTLPPYEHYVPGSALPAPDLGWDPLVGPPMNLRWTLPGGATAGGPTGQLTFQATVDWGNLESFEPGSGDLAAPEGWPLSNSASVNYVGAGCPVNNWPTLPAITSVNRFLFWKVGDNDLLFGPVPGTPPDEITYEIFVLNLSTTRTWWNVRIWDTVPTEVDPWAVGEGMEDPCAGWTMTPTGCAAASAGKIVTAGKTILTWVLDLPPSATLTVRWKAQVRSTTIVGATVINQASLMSLGRPGVVGGSGSSKTPIVFTHLAPVILPTTYISYVADADGDNEGKIGCKGYFLAFFPLNKQSQFELRGIENYGAGWATTGGVSQSIGCLIGDCINGFPGAATCGLGQGPISGGGFGGCRVERAPALYDPSAYTAACAAAYPLDNIYKLTSNSPVLWQMLTHIGHDAQDNFTYAPSSSLSFRGFMHYAWRRAAMDTYPGDGDAFVMVNTGLDQYGVLNTNQQTTVHLFEWNLISLNWDYVTTYYLGPESAAVDLGPDIPDEAPYRTMSSATQLIIYEGNDTINPAFCCCGCGDNFGGYCPNRENGNVVSQVGTGTFYGIAAGYANQPKVIIGNTGVLDATYEIDRYLPDSPVAVGSIPPTLAGSSGSWGPVAVDTVPAGLGNVGNPRIYGHTFDAGSHSLWRVQLLGGGPIQVMMGVNIYQTWSGGAVMHASNGGQSGVQYYWNHVASGGSSACKASPSTVFVNVFCSKAGMAVRMQSEKGYSATYTTTGPDQCIAFGNLTDVGAGKENYRIDSLTGANLIAQYQQCFDEEKGFTAPFLQTGVHYTIFAPPMVFINQSFWITVVVVEAGLTKDDYCGVTSFTSTDPAAKIMGSGMDAYNYSWTSNAAGSTCNTGNDNGVKLFLNVTLTKIGVATIEATDTTDGSISGITSVMVVGADIKLTKSPLLSVAASGDTVRFKICWSNYSSASGFSFVITDAIPTGMTYVPEVPTMMDCGNTDGVALTEAYSTVAQTTPPAMTTLTVTAPPNTTQWLRWTVPVVGVQTTGCGCYRVTVN